MAGVDEEGNDKINIERSFIEYNEFPGKEIHFYIGFPFDPTSNIPTGNDKVRFLDYLVDGSKYFALDEVLLANELWVTEAS